MAVSQERDQIHDLEVAAASDGKLLAIRDRGLADCGDGCEGRVLGLPDALPRRGRTAQRLRLADRRHQGEGRHHQQVRALAGPRLRRVADPLRHGARHRHGGQALRHGAGGRAPQEPRRGRCLIPRSPTSTSTAATSSRCGTTSWQQADLPGFRARQAAARAAGRYLGIGFGLGVELSGVASELFVPMENQPGYGAATVRLDPRGKVLVFEGDAPGGQGHETTVAQAVAHSFGIHPNDVVVTTGRYGHDALRLRHRGRARGLLLRERRGPGLRRC